MQKFLKKWNPTGLLTVSLIIAALYIGLLIFSVVSISARFHKKSHPTDQEVIADVVQEQFSDIYNLGVDHSMSLEEAETILWLWSDGEDVSEEDLKAAIDLVLEYNKDIRHLIYEIDEINPDDYR